MVAHVAGVEHLHGELAPGVLVGVELHGVELVVEDAALAAAQMRVEVVGLQAVHDGGGFADGAVFEADDGGAGGVVFVGLEDLAAAAGGEGADALDLAAHHHEEGVHGVAAGGEEGAAAVLFPGVPTELAVPRADAVVVVDLAVMEAAEEAFIDEGLGDLELVRPAALEADAAFDAVGLGGGGDFADFLEGIGHGLFQDDVLLGIRSGDGLVAVLAGVAGDVHDMDVGVGEHFLDTLVALDGGTMLGGEFGIVELPGGVDGGDLGLGGFVDGFDVGACGPAVSDDSNVVFLHGDEG